MRVICIDARNHFTGRMNFVLKQGETYEPAGETTNPLGIECYILSGLPDTEYKPGHSNNGPLYKKSRFIPLSTIDETELIEQRELVNN